MKGLLSQSDIRKAFISRLVNQITTKTEAIRKRRFARSSQITLIENQLRDKRKQFVMKKLAKVVKAAESMGLKVEIAMASSLRSPTIAVTLSIPKQADFLPSDGDIGVEFTALTEADKADDVEYDRLINLRYKIEHDGLSALLASSELGDDVMTEFNSVVEKMVERVSKLVGST